jgi:ribonucleoside-diphosphate reductase alpha chain
MGRVGIDEIEYYAGLTAHILDNGIALTNPPTEQSRAHNETFRTIGVGIQGYADLIAREWKSFLDTDFAADIAERIQLGCVKEGLRLAKVRGAYPEFGGSTWSTGEQIGRYIEHSKVRKDEWEALNSEVQMYGVRNSQFTSPAPNTTTSIFMDAGAGVMPVYGAFFYEDNTEGLIPVSAMYIKENPVSYMKDVTTFKPWDPAAVVGAMQYPWIDTGISSEYIMDKNQPGFKAKWLWDTLQASWENKNKAVYYIRTVKVGEKLVKGAADCVGCDG